MNVVFEVRDIEYVVGITDAKRILNNVYEKCDQVYVNGKKILVDRAERIKILTQLHGQLYV